MDMTLPNFLRDFATTARKVPMTPSLHAGLLTSSPHTLLAGNGDSIEKLKNTNLPEVLSFLDERPNVILSGLIHDNGLESKLNRGEYYGYRGAAGTLEGVALIGHATLL